MLKLLPLTTFALCLCISISSCSNSESCRTLFDKHYEKNIDAFVSVVQSKNQSIPSEEARQVARFILDELYKKDSTFVKMNNKKFNKFVGENLSNIMEQYVAVAKEQKANFQKYLDKNIESFTSTLKMANKDIPDKEANKMAEYLLNGLFKIDPNFINMKGEKLDIFISTNLQGLMKKYKQQLK